MSELKDKLTQAEQKAAAEIKLLEAQAAAVAQTGVQKAGLWVHVHVGLVAAAAFAAGLIVGAVLF